MPGGGRVLFQRRGVKSLKAHRLNVFSETEGDSSAAPWGEPVVSRPAVSSAGIRTRDPGFATPLLRVRPALLGATRSVSPGSLLPHSQLRIENFDVGVRPRNFDRVWCGVVWCHSYQISPSLLGM